MTGEPGEKLTTPLDPNALEAAFALTRYQSFSALTRDEHAQLISHAITAYLAAAQPSQPAERPANAALLDMAVEALRFYAEPTNYKGALVAGGMTDHGTYELTHHINLVRKDGGDLARSTLSAINTARSADV